MSRACTRLHEGRLVRIGLRAIAQELGEDDLLAGHDAAARVHGARGFDALLIAGLRRMLQEEEDFAHIHAELARSVFLPPQACITLMDAMNARMAMDERIGHTRAPLNVIRGGPGASHPHRMNWDP